MLIDLQQAIDHVLGFGDSSSRAQRLLGRETGSGDNIPYIIDQTDLDIRASHIDADEQRQFSLGGRWVGHIE